MEHKTEQLLQELYIIGRRERLRHGDLSLELYTNPENSESKILVLFRYTVDSISDIDIQRYIDRINNAANRVGLVNNIMVEAVNTVYQDFNDKMAQYIGYKAKSEISMVGGELCISDTYNDNT